MTAAPATLPVPYVELDHGRGLMPRRASEGAAGLDLMAAIDAASPLELPPFHRAAVPTGIALAIPEGYEGQVRPRSGLAARHGLTVLNAPGTVDADYRGEVMVILVNLSHDSHTIARGDRIAQLVVAPVVAAELVRASTLDATVRGAGGFGSTGR